MGSFRSRASHSTMHSATSASVKSGFFSPLRSSKKNPGKRLDKGVSFRSNATGRTMEEEHFDEDLDDMEGDRAAQDGEEIDGGRPSNSPLGRFFKNRASTRSKS